MDVTSALEKTISVDEFQSQEGQKTLERSLQLNFQDCVKTLSDIIHRMPNELLIRRAAVYNLRNALISQDDFRRIEAIHRWYMMQDYVRQYIKKNLMMGLITDSNRPSLVAECLSAVATAEFVIDAIRWRDLMIELISDSSSIKSGKMLQAASLDTIGFICRDIRDWDKEKDVVFEIADDIYECISFNLKQNKKHVKLAAINALVYALSWILPNRKSDSDKRELIELICETAKSGNSGVKAAAIDCLTDAIWDCYNSMGEFLDEEVFAIIVEAMTNKKFEILVKGTKLCRRVCYLESSNLRLAHRGLSEIVNPVHRNRFYTKSRLINQLNLITQILLKYELYGERDEDNVRESMVQSLTSLVLSFDAVFVRKFIIKFVEDNIYSDFWQSRNAAIRVYSALVNDEMDELQHMLNETLPLLIQALNDDSNEVKAATAHVIGKVCDHVTQSEVFEPNLSALIKALMKGLSGKPMVASCMCHALGRFAITVKMFDVEIHRNLYLFYEMYQQIVQKLLDTITRIDADNDLRWAAYHAVSCVVDNCSKKNYASIIKTAEYLTKKMQELQNQVQAVLLSVKYNHLISVLCLTLMVFLKKLRQEDCRPICFKALNILFPIFNSKGFDPEAMDVRVLWALTTFVKMLGDVFAHFMSSIRPCLIAVLKSRKKYSLQAAIGLLTEICNAVGTKFYPCCDDVIPILLEVLQNESSDRCLKQSALATLGSVAQVAGPYFRRFLRTSLKVLIKMQAKIDDVHMEHAQYDRGYNLSEMHKHFLRAYIGIVQSMKNDSKTLMNMKALLKPGIMNMVNVIIHIADKRNYLPMYDSTCVEVLSDLCTYFSPIVMPMMNTQTIYRLLAHARSSQNHRTKKLGIAVSDKLEKLRLSD